MKYIKWAFQVPLMLLVTVATVIFAPLIALFVQKRIGILDNNTKTGEGYFLIDRLRWFQTPDNSIDGDEGWRTEHWQWRYKLPAFLATYVGRVGWLWRNPGYGFGVIYLTNNGPVFNHYDNALLVLLDDYFQYRVTKQIGNKQLYCNFGWNIKGLAESPIGTSQFCTFAFSIRII